MFFFEKKFLFLQRSQEETAWQTNGENRKRVIKKFIIEPLKIKRND